MSLQFSLFSHFYCRLSSLNKILKNFLGASAVKKVVFSLDPWRFRTAMAEHVPTLCTISKAGNKPWFRLIVPVEAFLNMRRESNHCDECYFTLRFAARSRNLQRDSSHRSLSKQVDAASKA